MRKDPTEFRKRFAAYKNGKSPYKAGRPVEDDEFESFRQTLPDNQKPIGGYRTKRYWELNGKPKTFGEAIGLGMYTLGESGKKGQYGMEIPAWHANSVAYDESTGNYEFMKPNTHDTRWMEDVYGYWSPDNKDFRENYKLQKGVVYDKYVPKKNVYEIPKYDRGKDTEITRIYKPYIDEDGIVTRNVSAELPEVVISGNKKDYGKIAKQERAEAAKAANQREANIAKQYLNAGPSIGNLARAAYHWYNSVPMLGGQNESGFILQTGEAPTPGMRNPKAVIQSAKTITKANAAKITPAQWTAAQDAAIAKGDMGEAQRLRNLHFKVSAPNTKVVNGRGNPQLVIHKTPNDFTVFDNSRSVGKLNWAATSKAFKGEDGVFATGAGTKPKEMRLYVNMKNPHYPTVDEGMEPAFINKGEDGILGIVDKDMTDFHKSALGAGKGFNMSLGVDNPYALKSANAITYDNNGVRIPLGERDNFNINDIRYAFAPIIAGGIGYVELKKPTVKSKK